MLYNIEINSIMNLSVPYRFEWDIADQNTITADAIRNEGVASVLFS
jgi:hypothetical protein